MTDRSYETNVGDSKTFRTIGHIAGIMAAVVFVIALAIQIIGVVASPAVHMSGNPLIDWPWTFVLSVGGLIINSNTYPLLLLVVLLTVVMKVVTWAASRRRL